MSINLFKPFNLKERELILIKEFRKEIRKIGIEYFKDILIFKTESIYNEYNNSFYLVRLDAIDFFKNYIITRKEKIATNYFPTYILKSNNIETIIKMLNSMEGFDFNPKGLMRSFIYNKESDFIYLYR